MVIILPYTYHQILNNRVNITKAINFVLEEDWKPPFNYQFYSRKYSQAPITENDFNIIKGGPPKR